MEDRRKTEYVIQYSSNDSGWNDYAYFSDDTKAFERFARMKAHANEVEYRIVERTTIDTVLPY